MPPILIAWLILFGATAGPDLVKGLDPRPDHSSHSHFGKPAPQEYRTWTSTLSSVEPTAGACAVTYFAMATRGTRTRMVAGGVEQEIDFSWSLARVLSPGTRHSIAFEFRDPRSGAKLACQEQTVFCTGSTLTPRTTSEGECRPDAKAPGDRNGGRQSFVGEGRPMYMYNPAIGGAEATVSFVIRGKVNDAWWCPRLDVYWPDGTRTVRESDCEPYDAQSAARPAQRWTFKRGFPAGEWLVKACISKPGKVLACTDVRVIVTGGGN